MCVAGLNLFIIMIIIIMIIMNDNNIISNYNNKSSKNIKKSRQSKGTNHNLRGITILLNVPVFGRCLCCSTFS